MAQKEVGFVELEWTCPVCKTRNPGTQKTCSGCGAAQPENVVFENAAGADLLTDDQKIARGKSGPDIHCGFCGARNQAGAKVCSQCGADLTQGKARSSGQVVGAFDPAAAAVEVTCPACGMKNPAAAHTCVRCGAPLGKPAPAAAPAPQPAPAHGGFNMLWIGIAVVVVLVIAGFMFLALRTEKKTAVAQAAQWQRTIAVEGLAPVRERDWRDQVPADAANISCQPEVRSRSQSPQPGAREVCGTPYTVDTGTGIGKVVQDCEYEILDDLCSYTVMRWRVVNTLVSEGAGFSPVWPAAQLANDQRFGERSERYVCVFTVDGKEYRLTLPSARYDQCQPGTKWTVDINGLGDLVSAERE